MFQLNEVVAIASRCPKAFEVDDLDSSACVSNASRLLQRICHDPMLVRWTPTYAQELLRYTT